jgi:hypothetical protein
MYIILIINSYQIQLHNVDLVYNNVKDPVKAATLIDEYEVGKYIAIDDLYIHAINILRQQHIHLAYFAFAFGFAFALILQRSK